MSPLLAAAIARFLRKSFVYHDEFGQKRIALAGPSVPLAKDVPTEPMMLAARPSGMWVDA